MLRAVHPHTFHPAGYLTPAGADLFARVRTRLCFTALAELLAAAGTDVTFRCYPGADHSGPMATALPELIAWAITQTTR